MTTPNGRPITLDDLLDEIENNLSRIYIRTRGPDGSWGAYALSELPVQAAVHHAFDFIRRGAWPVRLKTKEEEAGS